MEKIRRGEDVQIELELPNELNQVKIPPLLFTPFIENAFKYVSNHDDGAENKISLKIRLQEDGQKLRFETQNTVDEKTLKPGGGIGIENVKKRLNLIFPKRHDLDIFKADNQFVVRMSLSLMALVPLKNIFELLSDTAFIQIHKSFVVAKNKVEMIVGNQVSIDGKLLPISTRMKKEVLGKLTGNRLLKK